MPESALFEKGLETLKAVDPELAEKVLAGMKQQFPDLGRLAVEFGYGRVMCREGLDLRTRELLNIAILGAMGNAPLQLELHVHGALNTGATKEEIMEVVLQLAVFAGFPAAFNTVLVAQNVFAARASAST